MPSTIVGIDGSPIAAHALRWALHRQHLIGVVTPVSVFQLPMALDVLPGYRPRADLSIYRQAARARLDMTIDSLGPSFDRETIRERSRLIEGHPGASLVGAASEADLLILGTRGRGAVAGCLLGSVSAHCARHSPVPVVVVPPECVVDRPMLDVVVGVDGSVNSDAALRWALHHTAPDGRLRVVGAAATWASPAEGYGPPVELIEKQVLKVVEESVARLGHAGKNPEIVIVTAQADARVALRDIAGTTADLLVVGARGTSGLAFLTLGSVSTAMINHPLVPTAVVPLPGGVEQQPA